MYGCILIGWYHSSGVSRANRQSSHSNLCSSDRFVLVKTHVNGSPIFSRQEGLVASSFMCVKNESSVKDDFHVRIALASML